MTICKKCGNQFSFRESTNIDRLLDENGNVLGILNMTNYLFCIDCGELIKTNFNNYAQSIEKLLFIEKNDHRLFVLFFVKDCICCRDLLIFNIIEYLTMLVGVYGLKWPFADRGGCLRITRVGIYG